ncbi:YcxB family protein [uncultured Holdemanella sp.]|uniref:YcxB family protein n=1 Tax=uncultured Holdemanella sp. TaxID=1763549 RepID=UPI002659417D|nr:YcxB family protein [uncultured Holdemanella sp.]
MEREMIIMIKTKLNLGPDEFKVIREIILAHPKIQRSRKFCQIVCIIGAIIMGIDTLTSFLDHLTGNALISLVLVIIFIWGAKVGLYYEQDLIFKIIQNKSLDNLKNGTIEYIFDSDGVTTISEPEYVTSKYKWDAFQWWCVFKNYIYLQTSTKKIVLVKKSNLTPEDYESLISLLSTHVQQKEICH